MKKEKNTEEEKEEDLFGMIKHPFEFIGVDEVLQRKVSQLGNSGHISVPSKHIGKDAVVSIKSKKEEDKKNIH